MAVPIEGSHARVKGTVAILLTFTAGIVDIIGYLTVYHSFVAHMTGATVHLGNRLEDRQWPDVARALTTIGSFVGGSLAGRGLIEAGTRYGKRTIASVTLSAEALLVLAFIWSGAAVPRRFEPDQIPVLTSCFLLALLAAAMGLQTATLTRIGPLTIHTTFVTGMLNKMAQEGARWLFWIHDTWPQHASVGEFLGRARQHKAFRNARFMAAIWVSYMIGSVAGTWMDSRWKTAALYLPVVILLASIAIDQARPLSVEEERDQA